MILEVYLCLGLKSDIHVGRKRVEINNVMIIKLCTCMLTSIRQPGYFIQGTLPRWALGLGD